MKTMLLSVGIDIGTTTTQIVFSRLFLENIAPAFSVPRVEIVQKQVVYQGKIHLTPLLSRDFLDGESLRRLIDEEFGKAGISCRDTDTGAVIITGEAARKENARMIVEMTSELAGDFVVASAGPDMESRIAGKGSGAERYSKENGCTVANLDIGGGTTNIVVFSSGEAISTGCYDIGGRLIHLSKDGRVEYVSASARLVAEHAGISLNAGERADACKIAAIAAGMNTLLEQSLGLQKRHSLLDKVKTAGSSDLALPEKIDAISFSGGVADCIYRPVENDFAYDDMGVLLGRAIGAGRLPRDLHLLAPQETIRATVIGAGSYTTTVSGSTIGYSDGVLPRKSLHAVTLDPLDEEALYSGDASALDRRMKLIAKSTGEIVLGLRGVRNPSYRSLQAAAAGIAATLDKWLGFAAPLFVAVEHDMGKALALCLERVTGKRRPVVCIDGVSLADGDFLDMGSPVMDGIAIPVVVKTLVFG